MSGYGVIADNIIYKDKAMLGRVDTGIAFILWKSLFLFRGLLLRVAIRTINNQSRWAKLRQ